MVSDSSQPGDAPIASLPDLDLLRRVAQKDESALAELIARFQNRVLNLAYRYLGNRDDGELITQDTFLKVWQHADRFRGSSQVWTWIYRITINLCLNMKSRKQLTVRTLDDSIPASEFDQPEEAHERKRQTEIVRQALESLPSDQRMAIVLSRFEGLPYEEIAQTMNKSVRAVATLLFRARENLKQKLRPFEGEWTIRP